MVISGITPRLHINPAFKVAICSNTSDLYKDGALTPPSLLLELLLLATGYDAQTCILLSHHGPALPRQHTAYHPSSPLEI